MALRRRVLMLGLMPLAASFSFQASPSAPAQPSASTPLYSPSASVSSPSSCSSSSASRVPPSSSASAPPRLSKGEMFVTYILGHRVRTLSKEESAEVTGGRGMTGSCSVVLGGEVLDDPSFLDEMAVGGGTRPEDSVLVMEKLNEDGGGWQRVAVSGAITGGGRDIDSYVCAQLPDEAYNPVDQKVTALLLRALWQWLVGPQDDVTLNFRDSLPTPGVGPAKEGGGGGGGGGGSEVEGGGGEEVVEWVTTSGKVICPLPRAVVHKYNLLHRGAGILVKSEETGAIYCHRRSSAKRVFPSMYDMWVGGVSGRGESSATTALREIQEELGVAKGKSTSDLVPLFTCTVNTAYNHCLVDVFEYLCGRGEEVTWQEEEVEWGAWISAKEVGDKLLTDGGKEGEDEGWQGKVVPDGLIVWEEYLRLFPRREG